MYCTVSTFSFLCKARNCGFWASPPWIQALVRHRHGLQTPRNSGSPTGRTPLISLTPVPLPFGYCASASDASTHLSVEALACAGCTRCSAHLAHSFNSPTYTCFHHITTTNNAVTQTKLSKRNVIHVHLSYSALFCASITLLRLQLTDNAFHGQWSILTQNIILLVMDAPPSPLSRPSLCRRPHPTTSHTIAILERDMH